MILLVDAALLVMREFGFEFEGRPDGLDFYALSRSFFELPDRERKLCGDACKFLRKELPTGAIPAACVENGRIRPITPEERQAGYFIDVRNNAMVAPWWGTEEEFPPLNHVRVCEKTILARLAAREAASVPALRRPGPVPDLKERVKAQMRAYAASDLKAMTGEEMVSRFPAGRTLCTEARREILPELELRQTPNSDR